MISDVKRNLISIHTLCEEGDYNPIHNYDRDELISIHTLCEEGDMIPSTIGSRDFYFNPHPLWRGRPRHHD